jgi:hypothetical protein
MGKVKGFTVEKVVGEEMGRRVKERERERERENI